MRGSLVPGVVAAFAMLAAAMLAARQAPATSPTPTGQAAPIVTRPGLLHVMDADFGFLPLEFGEFGSGSVVARIITSKDNREVAVAAAMHVAVPLNYYLSRITNVGLPSAGAVPADAGRFARPAAGADLAAWTLAPGDLKVLDFCDTRGCSFRLSDESLDRLRQDAGPRAAAGADAWSLGARGAIASYVAGYQSSGAKGLPGYRNGTTTISPAADFPALRARFAFLATSYSDLVRLLDDYPARRTEHTPEHFFWSLDVVLSTPVLTATHLVEWSAPTAVADTVLISQQIYTSREVDALIEVTLLAADTTPDQPGVTVVTGVRSLSSSLLGLTGGPKRFVARSQARTALAKYLSAIRTAFEQDVKR
jgi:hypothetical protein